MLTFYCYTWNKYLPEQELIEGTCSFHSMRNTDYMVKILTKIKSYNNSYIDNIKKEPQFQQMKSYKQLRIDLKYLIGNRKKLSLNGHIIKKVIKEKNLSNNIYPVYYNNCKSQIVPDDINNIKNIMMNKSYVIGFVLFKQRLNMVTHWCPVIIDKRNDIVNIHIADSYNMTWWGDPRINALINYLYPGKKSIKCIKDNIKGDLYYMVKTIFHGAVYFTAIYLFIYALFHQLKIL